MGEFLDNQTVTAASLNQIAIDLGKPTFTNFTDNTTYAIDALNGITASIVGKGIAAGVTNACKCTLANNKVTISTGLIFFNSGAKMRIEEAKSVPYVASSTVQYYYAYNDTASNSIIITSDESKPSDAVDAVMLCTVKNGILTDARQFSKAKVALPAAASLKEYTKELMFSSSKQAVDTFDDSRLYTLAAVEDYDYGIYTAAKLPDNAEVVFRISTNLTVYLKKNGTKITVSTKASSGSAKETVNMWII